MNNKIQRFFLLISDNNVLVMETNLKSFYEKVIEKDIGLNISLSTFRKRFIENKFFTFPTTSGRIYYFQNIENETRQRTEIIQSKNNF
jgi:hypothetical protein